MIDEIKIEFECHQLLVYVSLTNLICLIKFVISFQISGGSYAIAIVWAVWQISYSTAFHDCCILIN